jgi:hypothetical protein
MQTGILSITATTDVQGFLGAQLTMQVSHRKTRVLVLSSEENENTFNVMDPSSDALITYTNGVEDLAAIFNISSEKVEPSYTQLRQILTAATAAVSEVGAAPFDTLLDATLAHMRVSA